MLGGAAAYVHGLKYRAKDDLKLLQNLYNLTILFNMLEWSCNFKTTEKQKECLIKLIKNILLTQDGFCYKSFDDGYGNVNIPQTVFDFRKYEEDHEGDFIIARNGTQKGVDQKAPWLEIDKI